MCGVCVVVVVVERAVFVEGYVNAALPGKVGGECCQRDCHQVTLEGQRTAEPSVLRLVCIVGTWKVTGQVERQVAKPQASGKMEISGYFPLPSLCAFRASL